MKNNALIIFTRNPELGKVKTRLAVAVGDHKALEVYNDLLRHTMTVTQAIECDKFVFYDNSIMTGDIWSNDIYNKEVQFGIDLGAKMHNAFQQLFDLGYKNCLIVGSDVFDLKTKHITEAFDKLKHYDVVVGPAEDGGYYLLGLKQNNSALFKNKDWGSATVFSATINDLKNSKIALLETLNDIDTLEDLNKSNYFKTNAL